MCDWWSFGIIMFEMLSGYKPFDIEKRNTIRDNIYENITWCDDIKDDAKDLISKLLVVEPNLRIGYHSIDDIRKHKFFENVDFDKVLKKEIEPPFIPEIKDEKDLKYFNPKYTQMELQTFPNEKIIDDNDKNNSIYEGFSYYDN